MTWFKVDDSLPDHPKVLRLQTMKGWQGALALWTLAGAWAAKQLTDGRVPASIVGRFGCAKRDAELLVIVGLWEPAEGGYTFHSWYKRNPTRTDVETKREKTRIRVTGWRKGPQCNAVTDDVTDNVTRLVTNGVSNGGCNASPVPSRPVPSGDHSLPFVISPGARTSGGPSAGEIRTRFQALFQAKYDNFPYMGGGEVVGTFPERLRQTAAKRGVDVFDLLVQTFERWASRPLDEIAQNAPYASFAAKFGSLCEPKGANGESELDRLQSDQAAALKSGDLERYRSLLAEEKRRKGKV